MKTLAMLGALGENPNSKFRVIKSRPIEGNHGIIGCDEKGEIDWYNEHEQRFEQTYFRIYGTLGWEWELYQEPVDFVTATNSGKQIRPADNTGYGFAYLDSWLKSFVNHNKEKAHALINGLWEIEP